MVGLNGVPWIRTKDGGSCCIPGSCIPWGGAASCVIVIGIADSPYPTDSRCGCIARVPRMEWETTDPQMVRATHTGMACCSWISLPLRGPHVRHGAHGDAIMPPSLRLTHAPLCAMIAFPETLCLQRRLSDF